MTLEKVIGATASLGGNKFYNVTPRMEQAVGSQLILRKTPCFMHVVLPALNLYPASNIDIAMRSLANHVAASARWISLIILLQAM